MRINTSVRIRPLAGNIELGNHINEQREKCSLPEIARTGTSGSPAITVHRGSLSCSGTTFNFPASVVTGEDQDRMFLALGDPVLSAIKSGKNATIIAYGQTGSGKTHTMLGPPGSLTLDAVQQSAPNCPSSWGIFPRAMFQILSTFQHAKLRLSCVEIFHDQAYDLLDSRSPLQVGSKQSGLKFSSRSTHLSGAKTVNGVHPPGCRCGDCWKEKKRLTAERKAMRERGEFGNGKASHRERKASTSLSASSSGFATVGETVTRINSLTDVASLSSTIEATRTASSHALNDRSSRSHCLIRVELTSNVGGSALKQTLLFVDLAGSERISKSGATGAMAREATSINSSLTVLGRVIQALGTGKPHVPYRDSCLTRLLRSDLEGGAVVSVCICVADGEEHEDETVCSLRFGSRMSVVRNEAREEIAYDLAEEAEGYREKLQIAQKELAEMETKGYGEMFAPGSNPSEIRSYLENKKQLQNFESQLLEARKALLEAKSKARRGGDGGRVGELAARVGELKQGVDNIQGILLRQRSIKGFVIAPKKLWVNKQAQVRELLKLID